MLVKCLQQKWKIIKRKCLSIGCDSYLGEKMQQFHLENINVYMQNPIYTSNSKVNL